MGESVWVVGRWPEGDDSTSWEFQGVFSTEAAAVAACADWTYFVGPATLDEALSHESTDWPGCYFPITR